MLLPRRLAWGSHHYTHFFFELDARPPHALRAVGPEFCVGGGGPASSCEVVQYVTGLSRARDGVPRVDGGDDLVISYGVSDCEPRWATLSLRAVLAELAPFAGNALV